VAAQAGERSQSAYNWNLPPGFPVPSVPADNPMSSQKVELGRRLFGEPRLSITGQYACSSCHQPELAYSDGKSRALGATGEETKRSAMSLSNVAYNPAFTWGDPRIDTLERQMLRPLFNQHPVEMGLAGRQRNALQALSSDPTYLRAFSEAFPASPKPLSTPNVIKAIAAYERTLISGRAAFDRYVFDDDDSALAPEAKRGMALFYSKRVGCGQCHGGINFSGPIRSRGQQKISALFANNGLYSIDGRGAYPTADIGLMAVTHRTTDMGKFRVPTLRNIALTAPYMHDGSMATLAEVIDHYAQGGRQLPAGPSARNHLVDRRIRPFHLTAQEKDDLIAFLQSLTDGR
jgi:cytochrome c peroxidase